MSSREKLVVVVTGLERVKLSASLSSSPSLSLWPRLYTTWIVEPRHHMELKLTREDAVT